jgi:anaerobic selenocysteine-containing dehydrogenase
MDASAPEIGYSACPHDCPSTCALEIERLDPATIGRVRGARDNTYTAGVVCAKVARYAERTHHPDRLLHPLRRTGPKGSGEFERISWDDALDAVADGLLKAEQEHGSEAVWPYFYAGTMGLVMRDGIHRLRHVKRYSGQHSTICVTMAWNGYIAGTGRLAGPDPREMAKSDLVVIWGTNPVNTQINVMTHAILARKERGAKIVTIDTYRTGTADQSDMFICVRPGTDGALACAVMHVLFRDGHADRDYMAEFTDVPDELERHLKTRTPEWASKITGVPVAEIEEFARLIGTTPKTFLRLGFGFARQRNGSVNMHATSCIASVMGSWRYEGGGAFHTNGAIFHWDKTLVEGLDVLDPDIRLLDQSRIGAILTGDAEALHHGPPVTAMLIQNTNPMMVAPDLNKVHAGFARDDLFVCVHEQFMTETAKMADIVLPATTFVEHDDIYQGGGHQHIILGDQVIEPLGEARNNHQVLAGLAPRLGAEHPGFDMTPSEHIDWMLRNSGWGDLETLRRERWIDCQPDFEKAHYVKGFKQPGGKFRFAPDWASFAPREFGPPDGLQSMPRLPDHWEVIEEATAEMPFRMVTAPARNYLNSSFTETPTSIAREERPTVMINPADAENLGVDDGNVVRLSNDRGTVLIHVDVTDKVKPGVVVVESIWPNHAFIEGIGINALTGADPGAPIGGAAFHDNRIRIEAAAA